MLGRQPAPLRLLIDNGPRIRRFLLLALVGGFPLLFLWHVANDPFNLPKLVFLTVLVSLVGGLRLIEAAYGRGLARMRPLLVPALLLSVPMLAAWLATTYKSWSLIGSYGRYEGLLPYLLLGATGLLIVDAFDGSKTPLAWTFVAGATGTAIYGLIQALGLDPLDLPTVDGSVTSSIGQPNFLGGYLAVALPIAVSLWLAGGRSRLPAMGSTVVLALGILVTFSQGPWGAAVAGLALLAATRTGTNRPRLAAAAFSFAALIALGMVGSVVYAQVNESVSSTLGTTRARGYWWRSAIGMWEDRPLFGHGPNVYAFKNVAYRLPQDALAHDDSLTDSPHSVPLSFLANEGLLGFVGWLGIVAWAILKLPATTRGPPLQAGFAAATLTYFVQSLVSIDQFSLAFVLWVCLGGLAAFPNTTNRATRSQSSSRSASGALRLAAAVTGAIVAITWASVWSFRAMSADRLAFRASRAEDKTEAMELYERAIGYRDIVWYRTMYGNFLGRTAVTEGQEGAPLIDRMNQIFSITDVMPNVRALNTYAFWTHSWSAIEPGAGLRAIELYERSLAIDPHAPLPRIVLAEAHLHMSDPEMTISTLNHLLDLHARFPALNFREPDARALTALALIDLGRFQDARLEFDRAREVLVTSGHNRGVCQIEVADSLLAAAEGLEVSLLNHSDPRLSLLCSRPMRQIATRLLDEVAQAQT